MTTSMNIEGKQTNMESKMIQAFYNKVSKVVNRNQDRAWDFVLKQQENFNN